MTDTNDTAAAAPGPTLAEVKAEADATAAELARHEAADNAAPAMGDVVIVHHKGKKAPGIVVDVREDGTLDVQVFRGDHLTHSAFGLSPAQDSGDGWSRK